MLNQQSQQVVSSLPSVTDILRQAWSIYKKRIRTFLGINIIPTVIIIALLPIFLGGGFFSIGLFASKLAAGGISLVIILVILFFIIIFVSQGWEQTALLYAIKDNQESISVIESYRRGWHKILSYWWVSFLVGTIIFFGFLFFIVPGVIFGVWFSLAAFVLITDDLKGMKALLKSKEYVKGKWGSVFWRFLFIWGISLIFSLVITLIFSFLKIPFGGQISRFLIGLFLTPLVTIYSFLIYSNLRASKGELTAPSIEEKKPAPNKKNLFTYFLIAAVFISAVLISFWSGNAIGWKKAYTAGRNSGIASCKVCPPEDLDFSLFWETWRDLKSSYVDPQKIDTQKMIYGAISGMVNALGDPYTVFFNPDDTKKFNETAEGVFEGIGAEIDKRNGQILIVAPLEGTPAQKAGLRAGDKILKIDDKTTDNMTSEEAVSLIRGPKNTEVTLTILREGLEKSQEFKIKRALITVPSVKWELKTASNGDKVAYIRLYQFSEYSASDFSKAASEILKSSANKLILDLRDNPGGYLYVTEDLAGWFLKRGDLILIEDSGEGKEKNESKAQGNEKFLDFPMVVLINNGSASASEILAGALRDDRGVKLIGEKSFGKGTVQQLMPLSEGSSLKITIAKWLTPKGQSIIDNGLEPDIKVEMTEEDYEKERDPQLDKALEVIGGIR